MTREKKRIWLAVALFAIFAVLAAWIVWGNTAVEVTTHTVTGDCLPEVFDGYRIAHISDLHNAEFGEDNETLLALLRQAEPDMIAITGDLIDFRRTDVSVALDFAAAAMEIAPCYYVPGNHESRVTVYSELKAGLTALGVAVLENERVELAPGVTVLGLSDPGFGIDTASVLQTLQGDDSYTVLLAHRPEYFDLYAENGVDLALCGHAHGGQIRLPFVGGLVAPNQGLFPRYDAGMFTEKSTTMLVSRGLGNSLFPFRVNNRPELVLITLKSRILGT